MAHQSQTTRLSPPVCHQLSGLAKTHGTPIYVYDADVIKKQIGKFRSYFPYQPLSIHYAMKANSNCDILNIIKEQGCGLDAVSIAEVLLARLVGFSPGSIIYTSNMIDDHEMHQVHKQGVLFNIDSLSRLQKYGQSYPGSEICLRLNPNIKTGHHRNVMTAGNETKFGISLQDVPAAIAMAHQYSLRTIGIHEHAGSGIPEQVDLESGLNAIFPYISPELFPHLRFCDFGGGFKVPYPPGETVPDYTSLGRYISHQMNIINQKFSRRLEMRFEPGRFLVAEAGWLIIEVNTIKINGSKVIVGVNSGFPQLIRPMFYGAYHEISNLTNPLGSPHRYDIVGNICESGDHFASDRQIAEIREGDLLAIHTAGAYCYSMGGTYNLRPLPSEITIDGDSLHFRPALTSQQLAQICHKNSISTPSTNNTSL